MNTRPPNASDLLTDARRAMRRKALECLTEADRLDALYAAATASPAGTPHPHFDTNPHGDPI